MKENSTALIGSLSIPVANIRPHPKNPRRRVLSGPGGAASVAEMVRSLQSDGLQEPILVRKVDETPIAGAFYELIAGERRWLAFKQMGWAEIPARVMESDDAAATIKCLMLFLQAKGAGPMEEAQGYRDALDLRDLAGRPVFTAEQVAQRVGKTADRVRRMALLCELPEFAQAWLLQGEIGERVAWLIARLPEMAAREEVARETMRLSLSIQGVEALIAEKYMRNLRTAAGLFDRKDAELVPAVGSCETCLFRTGANPERFGECKNQAAQWCTKPECFRGKVEAARAAKAAKLIKQGLEVLSSEACEAEYPAGMKSLRYDSGFVRVDDTVPADLLKRDVSAHGAVRWDDLLEKAEAKPQQYAGFNQLGDVEVLVKRAEAIAAIDAVAGDRHVFRESDRKAARPGAVAASPAAAKSRAESQESRDRGGIRTVTLKSDGEPPEMAQVRHELAAANGLLVELDEHLKLREYKLPAKIAIRLEAHLARHGLSEDKS